MHLGLGSIPSPSWSICRQLLHWLFWQGSMLLGLPWRPIARVESNKEAILEMARSLHEALWITFPVYVQTWERTSPDCLIGNEYGK